MSYFFSVALSYIISCTQYKKWEQKIEGDVQRTEESSLNQTGTVGRYITCN
ncbi:MAG: hypothetical protein JST27_05500 [Bacteroidetes bacterium]|nr:hypothetical protein [Bacteroidota bacterium]